MGNTSNTGRPAQDGEVSREEMIADLRNCGWTEEDLAAIPDFRAS